MKSRSYKKRLSNSSQKKRKPKAFLFGPFMGELSWEFYRFAPYAIYLKKLNPDVQMVVLTREERFSLYGVYADILIPLRIRNDDMLIQKQFGSKNYKPEYYDTIKKYFYEKYKKRFDVIDHFCPLIHGWKRKVKWQFPRDKMNYDFQPQGKISDIVKAIIGDGDVIVDTEAVGYLDSGKIKDINSTDIFRGMIDLAVVIESIKQCEFVVGNMKFDLSKLSILLKKPLISLKEKLSDDEINLLNPLNTPIIKCKTINEGVEMYENNFRPEKSGIGKQRRLIYFNPIR